MLLKSISDPICFWSALDVYFLEYFFDIVLFVYVKITVMFCLKVWFNGYLQDSPQMHYIGGQVLLIKDIDPNSIKAKGVVEQLD